MTSHFFSGVIGGFCWVITGIDFDSMYSILVLLDCNSGLDRLSGISDNIAWVCGELLSM
jgi:hypothetical protein